MLIVTGTIAYDYIMDFPGQFSDHILPEQLHHINLSFIVNKFARRRGGTAGNISYALGMLKTEHKLFSVAGKDFEEYKKAFEEIGISLAHVEIDSEAYTSTGFAMTDKINNQIWGYFYGAAEKIPDLDLAPVAKKDDLVLVGPAGAAGSMSMVNQCIKLDVPYLFDPGFILTQVSDSDLAKGVEHAKYIFGNDYEVNLIKSRVKGWKKSFADKIVITTLGAEGAVISDSGQEYQIKATKVKNVVDPTGAGDAWRAGFLTGIEKGYDMQISGQMGAVASAYAVEVYGTQEYEYTKKEFEERYRQNYDGMITL